MRTTSFSRNVESGQSYQTYRSPINSRPQSSMALQLSQSIKTPHSRSTLSMTSSFGRKSMQTPQNDLSLSSIMNRTIVGTPYTPTQQPKVQCFTSQQPIQKVELNFPSQNSIIMKDLSRNEMNNQLWTKLAYVASEKGQHDYEVKARQDYLDYQQEQKRLMGAKISQPRKYCIKQVENDQVKDMFRRYKNKFVSTRDQ